MTQHTKYTPEEYAKLDEINERMGHYLRTGTLTEMAWNKALDDSFAITGSVATWILGERLDDAWLERRNSGQVAV